MCDDLKTNWEQRNLEELTNEFYYIFKEVKSKHPERVQLYFDVLGIFHQHYLYCIIYGVYMISNETI